MTRSKSWLPRGIEDLLQGQRECTEVCLELFGRILPDTGDQKVAARALVVFQRLFLRQQQLRLGNRDPLGEGLSWEPGWFNGRTIADETRELLMQGERALMKLEERFAR
jgi:hypothetical protein